MFRSLLRCLAPVALVGAVATGAVAVSAPAANAATTAPSVRLVISPDTPLQYKIVGSGFAPGAPVQIVIKNSSGQTITTAVVVASLPTLLGPGGTFTYTGKLGNWPYCSANAYVSEALTGVHANPYPLPVLNWVCTS